MKTFFDSIFITDSDYNEIEYPIKLEYYKTIKTDENVEAKYGIEIVETAYIDGKVNVESKRVEQISNNENKVNEILTILKRNEVTPVGMQDVLDDIFATL